MAMFDMTDLILRLRDFLSEPSPVFWEDNELEDIINDIQREIAQTTCCHQTVHADLKIAANTRNVSNLGDHYRAAAIEFRPVSGNPFALRKILPQQIGRVAHSGNATPQCWFEYGSTISIDPMPGAVSDLTGYLCTAPAEISPAPNLGIGTIPTRVQTNHFLYYIGTTKYTKDAVSAGTALTGASIPAGKYGAWRMEISADGIIDVMAATENHTGYASSAAALSGLPAMQVDHLAVGTITVNKPNGVFTPDVTSLAESSVTASFADDAILASVISIPRQFWPLVLLGSMARALFKIPRYVAAAQQIESMYASELIFHAFDFYEQFPTPHIDMRYE